MRCVVAAEDHNIARYDDSLMRAHKTLNALRTSERPEAYEEGLLLLRALEHARTDGQLSSFTSNLNELIAQYAPQF
jgi:hypothetical protein